MCATVGGKVALMKLDHELYNENVPVFYRIKANYRHYQILRLDYDYVGPSLPFLQCTPRKVIKDGLTLMSHVILMMSITLNQGHLFSEFLILMNKNHLPRL